MAGRKPKPNVVKAATGNPGKRDLPDPLMRPEVLFAEPPDELGEDPVAIEEWRRVMPELVKHQLYARVDQAFLMAYCLAYAEFVRATAELQRLRAAVDCSATSANHLAEIYETTGRTGNKMLRISPLVKLRNEALAIMQKFGSEFGFSPVARVRVTGDPQGDLFGNPEGDNANENAKRGFGALGS